MTQLAFIAFGGALGAVARHLFGQWTLRVFGPEWPYGTFGVNVIGGLVMGVFIGWLAGAGRADANMLRSLVAVGILGGFTTFSAFSLDVVVMIERKAYAGAMGYAVASVVASVLALFVGLLLARRFIA
ncbi:MAG: fluoride efflux transporter CrcB [Maricaulis sp.]|jgi:CrcB protein|nr:fluoride efflux transporter CrcB [Maricaulis sp.]HAQ34963.1 fluoride efflux transporter CrcB [Alphaproteobacteria bacterium]|tara:strand:- start:374 stop:757 length:384 start_codon:yes stop_codon:yes gene_type:complete